MHLLRIITSMNPIYGGPPQGIRHVTYVLQNRGIKTTVVCLDVPGSTFLEKDTFPIVALGPTYTQVAYSKKIESYLFKHILEFDLVIIHGLWQYPSYCTLKVIRELRKKGVQTPKVYVMPHGMLDPWFQRAPSRRWKALRNEVYWALVERQV
ncbi:MAG: glycosyl transferase family 1, partial [Spirosomataceae bacterium]